MSFYLHDIGKTDRAGPLVGGVSPNPRSKDRPRPPTGRGTKKKQEGQDDAAIEKLIRDHTGGEDVNRYV